MDEIEGEINEQVAVDEPPKKSFKENRDKHARKRAEKKAKAQTKIGAVNVLKRGTGSISDEASSSHVESSDTQFDESAKWDGSSDALDNLINGSDPHARMEAVKIRLASTMDRYAFFNNSRIGFSTLTATQNRKLEFDIRCRTGRSLQSRILRGVPEAKRLLNGNKVQHMEKGTVHQRLRMIDTFVHKENARANPESPPPVKKINQIRQSLSTELPGYADIIAGRGAVASEPVLATTCGVPVGIQILGMSKSGPALHIS